MGRMQRQKGKRVEREAAEACRRYLYAPKECRRSRQADGATDADLHEAVPGVHAEVKGRKKIATLRWWEQAYKEARHGDAPIVLLREDQNTDFFLLMRLSDIPTFLAGIEQNRQKKTLAGSEEPE